MLKQGILTFLVTMLFAISPAMAHDNGELSKEYKENIEENKEAKGMPHPAHEMGEANLFNNPCSKINNQSVPDDIDACQTYIDNLKKNRKAKGMPHPAHEMGKGDVFNEKE